LGTRGRVTVTETHGEPDHVVQHAAPAERLLLVGDVFHPEHVDWFAVERDLQHVAGMRRWGCVDGAGQGALEAGELGGHRLLMHHDSRVDRSVHPTGPPQEAEPGLCGNELLDSASGLPVGEREDGADQSEAPRSADHRTDLTRIHAVTACMRARS
jgi:hypothetical protein